MITLESLVCGTPVLVTPVGGLPEVVARLAPELVLKGTGALAIARSLGDALRGEICLPSDAEYGDHVLDTYTWPLVAERIRQVYMETLEQFHE